MSEIIKSTELSKDVLELALTACATIAVSHTTSGGETRLRVGPIVKVANHKIHGYLYFTVLDSIKAERTIRVSDVLDHRFLFIR